LTANYILFRLKLTQKTLAMIYKITSMDEITSGIVNPRTYYENQKKITFIIFLAAANVIGIIMFFILSDDFLKL